MGSWLARRWLRSCGVMNGREEGTLRRFDLLAASLCILASVGGLWAATAVMGGTGLLDALGSIELMINTDYGHAGATSTVVLFFVLALRVFCTGRIAREYGVMSALAVFVLVRASMGHAGESGWWSVAMAVEIAHLAAISVWAGLVFVSAWAVVGSIALPLTLTVSSSYLDRMSRAATAAVAAILVTGLYNAWQRIGTLANLTHSLYATAFLFKVGLVAVPLRREVITNSSDCGRQEIHARGFEACDAFCSAK